MHHKQGMIEYLSHLYHFLYSSPHFLHLRYFAIYDPLNHSSFSSCNFLSMFSSIISNLVSLLRLWIAGGYPANFRLPFPIFTRFSSSYAKVIFISPTWLASWYSSFSSVVGSSKCLALDKASALTFSLPFLCITMNSNWASSAYQC